MEFRFALTNLRTQETITIPEMIGFDDFSISLKRDDTYHGVNAEFAANKLTFEGNGYDMIVSEYKYLGINAKIQLLIEYKCGDLWDEFYFGMLEFATYEITDSDSCLVTLSVVQDSLITTFAGRKEIKIDLEAANTLDGSVMPNYTNLGKEISIPAKTIRVTNHAEIEDTNIEQIREAPHVLSQARVYYFYKTPFGNTIINEFERFNNYSLFAECVSPEIDERDSLIYENTQTNLMSNRFDLSINYKLNYRLLDETPNSYRQQNVMVYIMHFANRKDDNGRYIAKNILFSSTKEVWAYHPFAPNINPQWGNGVDFEININRPNYYIEKGDFISAWIGIYVFNAYGYQTETMTAFQGSLFKLAGDSIFSPTPSKTFMIHETLSRITESITDKQLTVKRNYYGRTDSNVNPTQADGIGALRTLTNGLMLRRAEFTNETEPNPKFTVSFKDIIEGLRAIDAIGYGIEGNTLRIEQLNYFYNDTVVLRFDNISEIIRTLNPELCFGLANIGYAKWESETWNSIDGFHNKRQYRTNIINNKTFEQYSKLIADSYAIEATRRRQRTDPSSDWRMDNDTFIFDLNRIMGGSMIVTTGAGNDSTLIDPASVMNVELSPLRNAARWLSWILQGTTNAIGRDLIFTGSEGYSGAVTRSIKSPTVLAGDKAENQNISLNNIVISGLGAPLRFKPETVEFEYSLSLNDFITIKQNPYSLIAFNGELGWVKELDYDIVNGMCDFTLIPKA